MTSQSSRSTKKFKKSGKSEKGVSRGPKRGKSKRLPLLAAAIDTLADAPISVPAFQGLKPIYRADEYWCTAVMISSDNDIIDFLRQNLSPQVKEKFRKTVFGKFLELSNLRLSKQLVHSLLLRELLQPEHDCIYLNISGKVLYFGIEHFLLISGLKAVAEDGFRPFETGAANELCKKYFNEKNHIKKADIEALLSGKHKLASDKDCLILALVYFISYYLMGIDPTVRVPAVYFDCVKTGDYAKVAWGDLSFQATINGLKKNGREKKRPSSYRIEGCPLIFQVWFYEVCGACEGFICDRNPVDWTDFRPRMFHWRSITRDFRKSNLENMIFNRKATELHLKTVKATDQEIKSLSLQKFFPSSDAQRSDNQNGYIQGKEDELPSASRPKAKNDDAVLNALESMRVQIQQGFHVFNKKIDKTNKRLAILESCWKKFTAEGKEEERMVSEDESEKTNEGEKNASDKEEISQCNVSVDNANAERSLIPYKPLTFPFQIISDPNIDPVLRSNGNGKGEKTERDADLTLKRVKDMEEENCAEVTDGDIDNMTYKRRKIYIVDSVGCVISINTLL